MDILTRPEELVLLAVWKFKDNAYCNPIKKQLEKETGKKWAFGAVYVPLERLEKKGYLQSYFGEPTAERGGKRKKMYHLTPNGAKALLDTRKVEKTMWENISDSALEKLL